MSCSHNYGYKLNMKAGRNIHDFILGYHVHIRDSGVKTKYAWLPLL